MGFPRKTISPGFVDVVTLVGGGELSGENTSVSKTVRSEGNPFQEIKDASDSWNNLQQVALDINMTF